MHGMRPSAATVAHLSDSQADLGLAAAQSSKPVTLSDLVPCMRVRVRSLPTPVTLRRRDEQQRRSGSRPTANEK